VLVGGVCNAETPRGVKPAGLLGVLEVEIKDTGRERGDIKGGAATTVPSFFAGGVFTNCLVRLDKGRIANILETGQHGVAL